MEIYVLAGVVLAVVGALTTLGVLMYKLSKNNRSDLNKLVQSTKDLSTARRDNDGYKRSVEEIEHALSERTAELARERAGTAAARKALADANERLAASGDAASVAASINSALGELRALGEEVPDVPAPAAAEDDHG